MDRFYFSEQEKRIKRAAIIFSVIVATFITGIFVHYQDVNAQEKIQESLSEEVLRFHVLANSDSEEDQALKMKVKEAVLSYLEKNMPEAKSVSETKEWALEHADELESLSADVIREAGYHYSVNAAVTTCWFPEKTYGDVTFPQGNYQALRIEIGEGKGQNWWCVLYPSLCFMDATNAVVPEEGKQKLKAVLSEEEYACITAGTDFKIKWYFLENVLTF